MKSRLFKNDVFRLIGFLTVLVSVSFFLTACSRNDEQPTVSHSPPADSLEQHVEDLTGSHTRVTWVQDIGDGRDTFARGDRLRLMGFDSRDGQGKRVILEQPANYTKPMITPHGDRVVYTDRTQDAVMVVGFDGTNQRKLAEGSALEVWAEPGSGREFVYVGTEMTQDRAPSFHRVDRIPLDGLSAPEKVWDMSPVTENNFQLSIDGRLAGGMFPWSDAGVARLPNGGWTRLGRGCWVSLSPDDQHLFWMFDGAHRNLNIIQYGTDRRWQVNINSAPGIDGYEVYHPRWSNHPRIMTMTGPYTVGGGGNKIGGGGTDVSVHIGRFSEDFQHIEAWVRLTGDQWADFYPDVWTLSGLELILAYDAEAAVSGDEVAVVPDASPATDTIAHDQAVSPDDAVEILVRLLEAVAIPTLEAIAPYDRALVAHRYAVEDVRSGTYDQQEMLIAYWVIRDGAILDDAHRSPGETFHLLVEPYDDRPDLEGERLSMDSDALMIPLFYEVQRL
ncbi:hypothetical protein [Desulfonatronum sp. SC1]|uniref:hypothetical protein n=1 Tax=Desulfonatronum sp. SC1 TaxID=2109626 RepID=UPI000D308B63|nr:hypothetical protein [Desulfonatronum sp. SC1]PTN36515.1 hypothetical protein C6366_09330 [Desulfonatronum sp. SC1]